MRIEFKLRSQQIEILDNLQRFNILVAHRRFGKTVLAVMMLIIKCLENPRHRPQVHYYAPSYSQAKKVAWNYVKDYTQGLNAVYNESELKCILPTGGTIQLGSGENPDSSRGIYSDFVVLDEPAQMPTRLWLEILLPALSDRGGGALFIGTPAGRHGLFFDTYIGAKGDPVWWHGMYKASETGIIGPDELRLAKRSMPQATYDQEFECSFSAAVVGAYYGGVMLEIENGGQITSIPYNEQYRAHAAFDLGMNDSTAIWYFYIIGDTPYLFDYEEFTGTGLPDIIRHMRKKPYNYGAMVFPHDVNVQSLSTGRTRKQTLQSLGVDVVVAPKLPLIDGIDTSRSFLRRCRFDAENCKEGLEALRQYRSEWDDKRGVLRLAPIHDWSSHAADAFRYLATTELSRLTGDWGGDVIYEEDLYA